MDRSEEMPVIHIVPYIIDKKSSSGSSPMNIRIFSDFI